MKIREAGNPDRLIREPDRECTSCGVVLTTGPLVRTSKPSILFVEQLDQPHNPWGIPAGRTEHFETDPKQTACREVEEETGIQLKPGDLQELFRLHGQTKDRVKIIYSALFLPAYWQLLGEYIREEGIYLFRENQSEEIGRKALVPAGELFGRDHKILSHYYRWDVLHYLKAYLEGLWII